MHRAITAISFMFFGASILIFISALLIPMLKDSASPKEKRESELYKISTEGSPSSPRQVINQTPSEPTENGAVAGQNESAASVEPAATAQPLPSDRPLENAADHDQAAVLTESAQPGEATATQPPPAAPMDGTTRPDRTDSAATTPQEAAPASVATVPQNPEDSKVAAKPAEDAETRPAHTEPTNLLVLGEGYFSAGEIAPKASAQEAIAQIIPLINTHPRDNVIVEGHADKIMSNRISSLEASKLNKTVSLRRAIAVAMVLEQKGVASDRIIVSGRGDSVPIASNLTEEGRAKNRRVEIKLVPAQQ